MFTEDEIFDKLWEQIFWNRFWFNCFDLGYYLSMNITSHNGHYYWSRSDLAQMALHYTRSQFGSFVIDSQGRFPSTEQPNLFVVYMDYNFTVLYYCNIVNGVKIHGMWLLSREQKPDYFRVKVVEWGLEPKGLFLKPQVIRQTRCPSIDGKSTSKKRRTNRRVRQQITPDMIHEHSFWFY